MNLKYVWSKNCGLRQKTPNHDKPSIDLIKKAIEQPKKYIVNKKNDTYLWFNNENNVLIVGMIVDNGITANEYKDFYIVK